VEQDTKELPNEGNPDYFKALVKACIETYKSLPNDAVCLDYNGVSDAKLRAMILGDEEYCRETRSIYARQKLEELNELDGILRASSSMTNEEPDELPDDYNPRGPKKKREPVALDKDMLGMRLKAAQAKRDLLEAMANDAGDSERDAANFMFLHLERAEFEAFVLNECNKGGTGKDALSELTETKEALPESTSNSMFTRGGTRVDEESFFGLDPDTGEIVDLRNV
jgi:hypothetical protein